jgi:transglutaminase-like putative cysteine protease
MIRPDPSLFQPVRLQAVMLKLLFAAIYSLSLSQLVLEQSGLPRGLLLTGGFTLLLFVLLPLLTWQRYSWLITSAFGIFTALLIVIWRERLLDFWQENSYLYVEWFEWAGKWISGQRDGSSARQIQLALLITLLIAVLSYLLLARFSRPVPAAAGLLTVMFMLGDPLARHRLPWILLAGIVIIAALARRQHRSWKLLGWQRYPAQSRFMLQAVPVALVSLLLTVFLAPAITPAAFYSRQIEGLIDDAANRLSNPLGLQPSYNTFSIAEVGYYPLLGRLGGPVQLSDRPILHVSGYPQAMLLRGLVTRDYDGSRWFRDNREALFRFGSQMNIQEQAETFNLNLPDYQRHRLSQDNYQQPIEYQLTPAERPLQTIFMEGRPTFIQLLQDERFQIFFNRSGQLYSKYWLSPEQTILVRSLRMRTDSDRFEEHVADLQQLLDPAEKEQELLAAAAYLQLPSLPEYEPGGRLHELAASLTNGIEQPYARAEAIRQYLMSSAEYSLDVPVPPANVEFVSWFLDSGEGYCVYFATAMTMLCRLDGIPARYVEGFYAPASDAPDGERIVTGEYAHAWTEIYLAGIGWVALDATAGGVSFTDPDAEPDTPLQPTPTSAPEPDITQQPSPDADQDLPPDQDRDSQQDGDDQASETRGRILTILALFLLAVILAAYIIRAFQVHRLRHQPLWLARRIDDKKQLARYYRQELACLLDWLNLGQKRGESLRGWFTRLEQDSEWFSGREDLVESLISGLETAIYDINQPDEGQLAALARSYDLLEEIVRQNSILPYYLLRRILWPGRLLWPG